MSATVISRPLLENGDVMDLAEFRRRYEASDDLEHVELIEGVVYMPSPTKSSGHGREQVLGWHWLNGYEALHEGEVLVLGPSTIWMDEKNAPEPDAMMVRLRGEVYTEDGYLRRVPELVLEIANSSRSRDLHQKKAAYERNGVLEYIVWRVADRAIDWFTLRNGRYELRQPDTAGVIESEVFPGLRLHVESLLAHNRARVLAVLQQ
jgi:Uma2 family endonuclease